MVPGKYDLVMKNYPNSWSTNENEVESIPYDQIHHLQKILIKKPINLYIPSD